MVILIFTFQYIEAEQILPIRVFILKCFRFFTDFLSTSTPLHWWCFVPISGSVSERFWWEVSGFTPSPWWLWGTRKRNTRSLTGFCTTGTRSTEDPGTTEPWSPSGLVTNSILFCWLFKIKDQCKKVRFLQTHNQGLRSNARDGDEGVTGRNRRE